MTQLQERIEVHRVRQLLVEAADRAQRIEADHRARVRNEVRAPRKQPLSGPPGLARADHATVGIDVVASSVGEDGVG